MISNQRKCLAPDRGNVTDPNGIPDCQRFGHQPPLHRMENGMDADDALNLLRGPQISLPSSIRPTNTILYFSPSIGCKCNSNGWKFVRRGKRSMHPKKKWREGKIVTDCWILSDRCNRSFRFISDVWNARIFGRLAKKESIPMLPSDAPVPRINFTRNEFNLPRKHRVKAIAGSIINWFLFSLSLCLFPRNPRKNGSLISGSRFASRGTRINRDDPA